MHCQWLEQLDARAIEQRIKAADLILGVSDFIAAGLRRRFPWLAQRCSHICNGTDVELFGRPGGVRPTPKQILYVGRLAPEKDVHILLDAFRIVLAKHPDAQLKLIGPGDYFSPRAALFLNSDDRYILDVATRGGAFPKIIEDGRAGFLVDRSLRRFWPRQSCNFCPTRNGAIGWRRRLSNAPRLWFLEPNCRVSPSGT